MSHCHWQRGSLAIGSSPKADYAFALWVRVDIRASPIPMLVSLIY